VRYKIGLKLARIKFVRNAIDQRADLSEFRKPPTIRIFLGMFLIAFSFVMCWPAISALGALAIYYRIPWILVFGPVLYVSSHLCFLAGMALSGRKYSHIFLRWVVRCSVEKLLSRGSVQERSKVSET
jgi:hypothetical protein